MEGKCLLPQAQHRLRSYVVCNEQVGLICKSVRSKITIAEVEDVADAKYDYKCCHCNISCKFEAKGWSCRRIFDIPRQVKDLNTSSC